VIRFFVSLLISVGVFSISHVSAAIDEVNEVGRIPILEYHQVGPMEERWSRWDQNFTKDLEWLYNNGYRAISMRDFMNGWIDVPKGLKPVVFTFDDGSPTQLVLQDGKLDSYSAVGLMDAFIQNHPDFGSAAIFYINKYPFSESDSSRQAVEYLLRTGREIGQHTANHANLGQISSAQVEYQLSEVEQYVWDELGIARDHIGLVLDSIAYPFGSLPKGDGFTIMKRHAQQGLLVGADPAWPSYHTKYSAYHVPRIQAIDSEWKRWFRRSENTTHLNELEPIFSPYVSDGDPRTISLRNESERGLVSKGALADGIRVRIVSDGLANESSILEASSFPTLSANSTPPSSFIEDEKVIEYFTEHVEVTPAVVESSEILPYETCGNDDADEWIAYKRNDLWGKVTAAMGPEWRRWDFDRFVDIAGKWVRKDMHKGNRRGVYLNAAFAPGAKGDVLLTKFHGIDGNIVVMDAKKSTLRRMTPERMKEYQEYIDRLQRQNIYVVIRLVVAVDPDETAIHPHVAIQNVNGGIWRDNKGEGWLDLSHENSRHYIVALARQIAEMGVDELQLDYIRFPTDGKLSQARYGFDQNVIPRWMIIRDVIREVRIEMVKTGTYLSADFLGVVGWNDGYDGIGTGQKIECLAPYVDALYPMSYSSHFGPGFSGHALPASMPYFFTKQTADYFAGFAEGTETDIRPWLQAFSWRTPDYNTQYIVEQAKGVWDGGHDGYVLWNAGSRYDVAWDGMVPNEHVSRNRVGVR
jgi:peptidoglycan/xylan/chitin deacetylase (PgdA/CDA1 family)